mgnify:CR=1 FL=1
MKKEKRVCLRGRDVELIMFLAEYGIITNENVKLLYQSEYYYKNRLASLAKGDMIERLYGKVILSRKGKSYLNEVGLGYRNINRDETYKKRMERISDIACKVKSCGWYFEPSWKCDVNTYTKRGNRYVGIMSKEEKRWNEEFEDFYKRSYIVYFLNKDITPRELKYIDREINRNKSKFNGLIVFTEDDKYLYKPKFENIRYNESYIIPYNQKVWKVFKLIKDENFMNDRVYDIFGDKLISLKYKSFFDDYYIKENNVYTYIFYMPFANFYLMDYLNYLATDNLHSNVEAKVICLDTCVEYARKYLDEKVKVTCISVD